MRRRDGETEREETERGRQRGETERGSWREGEANGEPVRGGDGKSGKTEREKETESL